MQRDEEILRKVIEYCNDITAAIKRFGNDFEIFRKDKDYRNTCALCILQIGELCNNLSLGFRHRYNEMPWNQIRAMRNIVAHAYGSISTQMTWDTIQADIPALKSFCESVIADRASK